MERGTRGEMLEHLAHVIGAVTVAHPTRVAIDGPPASGKTMLADDVAAVLRAQGRDVLRATIDDFLVPRPQRYRRGEYSAESCYYDTHDCRALTSLLLDPFGPGGDRRHQPGVYDRTADAPPSSTRMTAAADAVLLFDGVFLMRPELIDRWDLRILVTTAFEKTLERAVIREQRVSTAAQVERRWRERYIPAQQLYFAKVGPADLADVVVHNDESHEPAWDVRAR